MRVTNYKIDTGDMTQTGNFQTELCFIRSMQQLQEAIEVLEDLSHTLELKMDFPFEHLFLDCILYVGLQQDTLSKQQADQNLEGENI